jgi:hypothetical protein
MPAGRTVSLPHAALDVYRRHPADVHKTSKIIRRTGARRSTDGIGEAC